jgi:exosortase A
MSAIPAEVPPPATPWRTALPAIAALWLALALLYRDTLLAMTDVWSRSDTFAHGWVVAPISLWLIWRQRGHLALLTPRPQPWVLLPMAALAAAWTLAELVVVNSPAQFAFVGLLILAVVAVLGFEVARAIAFPLLFLLFAVPFGEFAVQPMMEWTADFVVLALQWTGVPVFREGLNFVIPSGRWSVIDECSGVRYLMASFMVGSLFAYLNYRSYRRRAAFMAFSIAVPIVANWLRAYFIVMLGHLSGNRIAVGVDHILYGWVFFGVVIFVMFVVGMRWAEPDAPAPAAQPARASAAAGQGAQRLLLAALAVAALAAAPPLGLAGLQYAERRAAAPVLELPPAAPGWQAQALSAEPWTPHFLAPSARVQGSVAGAAGAVGVYVVYYRAQDAERKLVSTLNGLLSHNERQWSRTAEGTQTVEVDGTAATWRTTVLGAAGAGFGAPPRQMVAWQVYWVDGRFVGGDMPARLALALSRLRGHGDDGAAIVLHAEGPTPQAAQALLLDYVRAHQAAFAQSLRRTQQAR